MKNNLLILQALLLGSSFAGTVIADFNDNDPGPLGLFNTGEGQGGGLGFLTDDVWANTGTIAVINSDLTAPSATGYNISQSGTPQSVQGSFTAGRHTTRAIETPLNGTVWFSYLLNQPTVDSRGGITFNQNTSAPGNPRIVATGSEIRLGLGPTLQAAGAGADLLTLGETALILGRLTIDNTGLPDTLDLWINPDVSGESSSLPAPDTSLSEEAISLDSGITRVGIQSYSADTQGGIVDSLRISDAPNAFEVVTRDTIIIFDDPNLSISPTNPFASIVVTAGDAPLTIDLPIENTGASNTLIINSNSDFTGDDAASYSILTSLPLEIDPGSTGILQLQLNPSGSGRISSATLNLNSNDTSSATLSIPLQARILGSDGNQLLNGDFESDPTQPIGWITTGNTTLAEGIAPGSTTSASLAPLENLRQTVAGEVEWYLECFFQSPDTIDRAFNLIITSGTFNLNLRFQGTSVGAEQTWNLFDTATLNDGWGAAIPLPAIQAGATYRLRVTGKGWDGISPTYDLELSAPNSLATAGIVAGLNRFQAGIPAGPPNLVRFSTEFGSAPGFVLDEVKFVNGTPPPAGDPEILSLIHDPFAQTTTLTFATLVGVNYAIEASDDLENWLEIEDFTGTAETSTFVEAGVAEPKRFYRLLAVE